MKNTIVVEKYKRIIDSIIKLINTLYIGEKDRTENVLLRLNRLYIDLSNYTENQVLENIYNIILDLGDEHTLLKIKESPKHYFPICINWSNNKMMMIDKEGNKCIVTKINSIPMKDIYNLYYKKKTYQSDSMIQLSLLKDIIFAKNMFDDDILEVEYMIDKKKYETLFYKVKLHILEKGKDQNTNSKIENTLYEIDRISEKTIYLKIVTFHKKDISLKIEKSLSVVGEFDNIIIDLRNNPGGFIKEAKNFFSLFIDKKVVFPYEILKKGKNGYCLYEQEVTGNGKYKNKKIYLLVNEFTMSCSEYIVALGIKLFTKNKLLIGNKTAGVPNQASIYKLDEHLEFQLTVSKYTGLSDEYINGIDPDIYIEDISIECLI